MTRLKKPLSFIQKHIDTQAKTSYTLVTPEILRYNWETVQFIYKL